MGTLSESAIAQNLGHEANLALLEKSLNQETTKLRDDISLLKVLTTNVQRTRNEVTSRLDPSSQILDHLQHVATNLGDQQTTFVKNMEYYMYRIGVQFETSPVLQDRLQTVTGSTPPTPSPPNKWPTRTVLDSQTILELQMENNKKSQQINIKTCTITELETAVQDLEEDLQTARSRIEALHANMAVLQQANIDLRKINSESLLIKAKANSDPTHLSTTQA